MSLERAWFGVGLVGLFVGCGDPPKPSEAATCDGLKASQLATGPRGACPDDLPSESDCSTALPSYQTDVAPLLGARCGACHTAGGIEASFLFTPYDRLFQQRRTVLNQIFTCAMPPACAHGLEPDERALLLQWFVCGALDN